MESRLRMQRKINRCKITGAPTSASNPRPIRLPRLQGSRARDLRPAFDKREPGAILIVLAALVLQVTVIFAVACFYLALIA